ncbi:MAG: hypothetical protein GX663_02820 [Clostridiales bacterium]|nr:hypothetical protein [Clostridiales bacterium]
MTLVVGLIFAMTGCGGIDYSGEWKAVDVENEAGIHFPAEAYNEFAFVFNEDGTGKCILDDDSAKIEWTETEAGITVDQDGSSINLAEDDGQLMMIDNANNKIYFEKQ